MRGIELAPFSGRPTRIGSTKSVDSVVMLLPGHSEIRDNVVKWNKSVIASEGDVFRVAKFSQKAIAFYEAVLGKDYVVPTQVVIGQKKDKDKAKFKVYLVQPYVDGWNGVELPEDLREERSLLGQWRTLYLRLSAMYVVAREVNRRLPPDSRFPVNMTLGFSRAQAYSGITASSIRLFPNTPNILVSRAYHRISICDFGEYTPWRDSMGGAYELIKNRVLNSAAVKVAA